MEAALGESHFLSYQYAGTGSIQMLEGSNSDS
jgi:hypothetical protein